ncbi:MAG: hypothetical protein ACYS8W_07500 [Planctomycetota bacterium]|jgi:hypothetical protein
MKKRFVGQLIKEEKSLLLNGHHLEAISCFVKRTGSTLFEAQNAIYIWLQSRKTAIT